MRWNESKFLTEQEKEKLKDAIKHGYGVEMPGKWAERLMNEISYLELRIAKLEIKHKLLLGKLELRSR